MSELLIALLTYFLVALETVERFRRLTTRRAVRRGVRDRDLFRRRIVVRVLGCGATHIVGVDRSGTGCSACFWKMINVIFIFEVAVIEGDSTLKTVSK